MMKPTIQITARKPLAILAATVAGLTALAGDPVPMTGIGSYTQDFNSFSAGSSTTWNDDSTLESWYVARGNGSASLTLFVANTGGSTYPSIYNFGSSGNSDRALGSIGGSITGLLAYGVLLHNTSGTDLVIHALSYTGEQWRYGGNSTAHTLSFTHMVSASEITDADASAIVPPSWTADSSADFTGPVTEAAGTSLDGHDSANRVPIAIYPGITVPAGEHIMFRWADPNDGGNDHGLAIDDLSITWYDPAVGLPDTYAWAEATGATGGMDGDDDSDGRDNSFEYAFGLDPRSASSMDPFPSPLARDTGTFVFTRRSQSLTGLTYKVFTSTTLANSDWTEDTGAGFSVTGAPVNDVETVEVTLSAAKPLAKPVLFVRVVAE